MLWKPTAKQASSATQDTSCSALSELDRWGVLCRDQRLPFQNSDRPPCLPDPTATQKLGERQSTPNKEPEVAGFAWTLQLEPFHSSTSGRPVPGWTWYGPPGDCPTATQKVAEMQEIAFRPGSAPAELAVGARVHAEPFQISENDPKPFSGSFPKGSRPGSLSPSAMQNAAETHETPVSALSGDPLALIVGSLTQPSPRAGTAVADRAVPPDAANVAVASRATSRALRRITSAELPLDPEQRQ